MGSSLLTFPRWLGRASLELVCPPICVICSEPIEDMSETLCVTCWREFQTALQPKSCPTCGHNVGPFALIDDRCHLCQNRRPVISRTVRVGQFSGLLRQLIHAIKYRHQSRLDRFLGQLLAAAIVGDPVVRTADILMPVPLHWRRRLQRHHNQADLIARQTQYSLKQQGKIVRLQRDLVRIRHTAAQTTLAISARMRNVRGAFVVRPDADFRGRHVCLIDDVTTTGSTLRVAANALKRAQPAQISAAVLAVAGNDTA